MRKKMRFPETHSIDTPRCRLRIFSKADLPHIFSASRYPGFTDGMLWEPPARESELIELYEKSVQAWKDDRAYCFTIETKSPVQFVGRVTIRKHTEKDVWDLGFWTHPDKQNKGYMTEAVSALLDFGFMELMASNIVACHAVWNKPSEAVLKKVGMEFIEYIPKGFQKKGVWVDENRLGITLEKWKSNQA